MKENLPPLYGPVGFLSRYRSGPLPYVRCHITINKALSASLNKTFPSFLFTWQQGILYVHHNTNRIVQAYYTSCGALA